MNQSEIYAIAQQIYIMEAGILDSALEFEKGEDHKFIFDLNCPDYEILKSKYEIEKYAKGNSEFERAKSLMREFAPRLRHKSDYDNHVEVRALPLLEYCLDNAENGINCRAKSQIFNEMCLALGIYARKVWLMPFSKYDTECHAVNEIWDNTMRKWILMDITNNEYWVDENGTPLSILEIRYNGAKRIFSTPVKPNERLKNLQSLLKRHYGEFVYIMKNVAYTEYLETYTAGESSSALALAPNLSQLASLPQEKRISEKSVLLPPA